MAFINEENGELHLKIVYFGMTGSGKTANIQSLFKLTSQELSTRLFDIKDVMSRNMFFDFLPLSLGESGGRKLRLHLFTLPAHELWPSLNRTLLSGVDGFVFVLDSRLRALQENEKVLNLVEQLLNSFGRSLKSVPLVIQANHQDSPDALPLESLQVGFDLGPVPWILAAAAEERGTLESLETLAQAILDHMDGDSSSASGVSAPVSDIPARSHN